MGPVSRRAGAGGRTAGGGTTAGFGGAGRVSLGGAPALTIGTRLESGPITAKLAAESVCDGSTGLSKLTRRVTESIGETSRIRGGTESCAKISKMVLALSARLTETLSQASAGSSPKFLLASPYGLTV